jgi:adenosine deaminase
VDLKAVSKVDLHRHLEGAIRLRTLIDLYRDAGHPLSEQTPAELSPRAQVLEPMRGLEDVLSRFTVAQGAFFDEAAAERIAFEAVEDLAADNVRARRAPLLAGVPLRAPQVGLGSRHGRDRPRGRTRLT